MVLDSLNAQFTGRDNLTPMQIAQHSLFTAREKLDLLAQLKADAAGASSERHEFGFTAEEIDAAMAHVHAGVQDGVGTETVLKGDY